MSLCCLPRKPYNQLENIIQFAIECVTLTRQHAQKTDAIKIFRMATAYAGQRFHLLQFIAEHGPGALQHHHIHIRLKAIHKAQQPMPNMLNVHKL